ncbi:hypothetical protein RJD28_00490 [Oscillospiraceae bacterium NTUH-002-81]|nr:hypothetical protein RJD28_00490 [Oscillospiraceae bacterium NTUH-002-81]
MTPQKQSRSSALFLTELTLAILFFAAASAVCVQIFVKSHLLSLHSRQLNLAVNESAAIAELIEASDSMEEAVALITARYPLAEIAATSTDTVEKSRRFLWRRGVCRNSKWGDNAASPGRTPDFL